MHLDSGLALYWLLERDRVLPTMTPEQALDAIQARGDTGCEIYTRATSTTLRVEDGPQVNGCYFGIDKGALYTVTAARDTAGELELNVQAELADGSTWSGRHVVRPSSEHSPFEIEAPSLSFKGTARWAPSGGRFTLDGTGEALWSGAAARPYRMEEFILSPGSCAPAWGDLVIEYQDGLEYADLDAPDRPQRIDGPLEAALHFEPGVVAVTLDGKRESRYFDELQCTNPWAF
ncbi:hypothetical protein FGE12_07180 [Aggregicoccus sp. 17bor-14]|uniref:hypothetical protein n=1 Tax=Myxococcaceae TaxID=31 RepID=UPI00129D19EF|nr:MULTISPECIES: hypothetical protein [Myxococcaceae]MBF5042173.1 hypothetical protein [Simulacricoccus sp. 17bor-14]MRI87950.1 hypothetical protein [Aggregicoccus sp. 17bor-14]